MKRPLRRMVPTALLAIMIAASLTTGALAFWSGAGSGSATTELADVQALSFEPGTAAAQLYPGGAATVSTVATNTNTAAVDVEELLLDDGVGTPIEVDAGHVACDVAVLAFTAQDNGGAGWQIPPRIGANDGSLDIEMHAALEMSTAAASACQGATVTVLLKAGPR